MNGGKEEVGLPGEAETLDDEFARHPRYRGQDSEYRHVSDRSPRRAARGWRHPGIPATAEAVKGHRSGTAWT